MLHLIRDQGSGIRDQWCRCRIPDPGSAEDDAGADRPVLRGAAAIGSNVIAQLDAQSGTIAKPHVG
jgi:hypothetical protein